MYSSTSYLQAHNVNGMLCSGTSRQEHGKGRLSGCKGSDGKLVLACNDGRHFSGSWGAETCTSGQGFGRDQYGNTFVLAYGDDMDEVRQKVGLDGTLPHKPDARGGAPAPYAAPEPPVYNGVPGVVASPDGRIVTSAAALRGAAFVRVYLPSARREFSARVLSVNEQDDVAIIKVEAECPVGEMVKVRRPELE